MCNLHRRFSFLIPFKSLGFLSIYTGATLKVYKSTPAKERRNSMAKIAKKRENGEGYVVKKSNGNYACILLELRLII